MSDKDKIIQEINCNIDKLNENIEKLNQVFYDDKIQNLMNKAASKKSFIKKNFLAGIVRGVGIGIGVTFITALLVMILQKIVMLNIPGIGKYITEIVRIVEKNL